MQFEQERNQKMRGAYEAKILRLEEQIERTRARLEKARVILAKYETVLMGEEKRRNEASASETRAYKKQMEVRALEGRLEDLTTLLDTQRQRTQRVLEFCPIQNQLDRVPEGYKRVSNNREWRIPNSRFKTFQDVFTPTEARIVPDGRTLSQEDYDQLHLDVCPVDPSRVPDWFFEEFELGCLEGLDPFEKLERKAGKVEEIRTVFEHFSPLEAYDRGTHRTYCLNGHSRTHDGKILITAYSGREKDGQDRKIMQFFGCAYEAYRRTSHIDSGYEAEQEKIHGIKGRVRDIQLSLVGIRRDDAKMADIQHGLASEVEILGHVTNHFKSETADILHDVMNIRDGLGRHNPGATCARLVRALSLLERRLPQIFAKLPWIADDKRILSVEINKGKETMDGSYRGYLSLCRGLQAGETNLDAERRLNQLPTLDGLRVRPFNLYADKLREKFEAIKKGIQSRDQQSTHDEAVNAYLACKVFEVQHERERILRDIAESPIKISIEDLLRRAVRLREVAMDKETFQNGRNGFNTAYANMSVKIVTLVERLTVYSRQNLSEPERLAMYERLKKFLGEIEFTEILEKL